VARLSSWPGAAEGSFLFLENAEHFSSITWEGWDGDLAAKGKEAVLRGGKKVNLFFRGRKKERLYGKGSTSCTKAESIPGGGGKTSSVRGRGNRGSLFDRTGKKKKNKEVLCL